MTAAAGTQRAGRRSTIYGRGTALLVGPYLMIAVVAFIYPLVQSLVNTLVSESGVPGDAYRRLLEDPVFASVLLRTLWTAAAIALTCVALAYPLAEFLNRASPRTKPLLLALAVVPLWSSIIARTYGWVGIFANGGVVDSIVGAFGGEPLKLLYSPTAVYFGMVHVLLPITLAPVYGGLVRYDERLTRASLSLGASRLTTTLRVKLPALGPSIGAGGIAAFIISLGFFVTPAVLGGPRSQLISNLIAQQVFQRYDLERGQAAGVVLIAATLLFLLLGVVGRALVQRIRR